MLNVLVWKGVCRGGKGVRKNWSDLLPDWLTGQEKYSWGRFPRACVWETAEVCTALLGFYVKITRVTGDKTLGPSLLMDALVQCHWFTQRKQKLPLQAQDIYLREPHTHPEPHVSKCLSNPGFKIISSLLPHSYKKFDIFGLVKERHSVYLKSCRKLKNIWLSCLEQQLRIAALV